MAAKVKMAEIRSAIKFAQTCMFVIITGKFLCFYEKSTLCSRLCRTTMKYLEGVKSKTVAPCLSVKPGIHIVVEGP